MFKKFKGHYSKRKTHKTDRDVMSYEDMPLDDYEQEKTEMSPQAVKKIVLGACIAIAAGLIVFVTRNSFSSRWIFWSPLPKMAAASSMLSSSRDRSANIRSSMG